MSITLKKTAVNPSNQTVLSKKLIVDEYKKRLQDNFKSLHENFFQILTISKVNLDDSAHRNVSGRMAEYNTIRVEIRTRTALMVKAIDELLMLTNDIREFLVLRDFNILSQSIAAAERCVRSDIEYNEKVFDNFRHSISSMTADIDKELFEHFSLRY